LVGSSGSFSPALYRSVTVHAPSSPARPDFFPPSLAGPFPPLSSGPGFGSGSLALGPSASFCFSGGGFWSLALPLSPFPLRPSSAEAFLSPGGRSLSETRSAPARRSLPESFFPSSRKAKCATRSSSHTEARSPRQHAPTPGQRQRRGGISDGRAT